MKNIKSVSKSMSFINSVIIIKVPKRYKRRITDQNDVKFERNIIGDGGNVWHKRKKPKFQQ